jgi:1,4-dihydroxy-2-naphthoate polyprenyltransferase
VNKWVLGARPRTWPAAVVPVLVGTACAHGVASVIWWRAGAALVVALSIQVMTNYVNDVADGVRGTDTTRVGPVRLVAGGLATAAAVKRAAAVAAVIAAAAGIALTVAVGPELLAVGAASIAAGYLYTGGSKPYGYYGFGELFVFVFFGLVATVFSTYVHTERVTGLSLAAAVPVGLLCTAILVANNLRDIPTDRVAGKRTLAVRIGDHATRILYGALVGLSFVVGALVAAARPWALLSVAALVLALPLVRTVARGATGRALIPVLGGTARLQLAYGSLLAVGLWLSG